MSFLTPDIVGAFGGALLGSLSAFLLGRYQQFRDKKEKQHAALIEAYYALGSQWNILEGIKRSLLDPHKDVPDRHLKMPLYYSFGRAFQVPLDDIAFIAGTDEPDLLNQIHIAEQYFETAIETLRERTQRNAQLLQSVQVRQFDSNSGRALIGAPEPDVFFLKQATDVLYEVIGRALPKLEGEMQALEDFTRRRFKGMKALKLTPK